MSDRGHQTEPLNSRAYDLSSLTPRELGAAVTPLFILDSRHQQAALNELIIRCDVAERLLAERSAGV